MACNCNTASKTCDPCAFCTPPGVTGLTTCHPIDPCEEKPDIKCFFYNGPDADCLGISQGDDLTSVLNALLQAYFPPGYCCSLAGTATWSSCYLTGYTVWANPVPTTTAAPTTTSTTTQAPACSYYEINNTGPASPGAVIQYVPCNCLTPTLVTITTGITICVNNAFPIVSISGSTNLPINAGPCSTPPCPTTSTTTASAPCTCSFYEVVNNNNQPVTITYTACTPTGNQIVSSTFGAQTDNTVCACSDIQQNIAGVVITNSQVTCSAPPTTSTTTIDCTNNGGTATLLENFIMVANAVTNIAFHIISSTIAFKIDWGDGTVTNYPPGYYYHSISHTYTSGYSGQIVFYSTDLTGIQGFYDADYSGSPSAPLWPAFNCLPGGSLSVATSELGKLDGMVSTEILNTKTIGDIADLPDSLTYLVLWGNGRPGSANCQNTLSGNIANMPPLAKFINILGANTLTGDIGTLPTPPGIALGYYLTIRGVNTVWGDIANLPVGVVGPNYATIRISGNNTITGDIANLPSDYLKVDISGGGDSNHSDAYGNTIYGNLVDLNPNLIEFNLRGDNTLTGDLSDINCPNLTIFYLRGKSTITGDINDIVAPNLETLVLIDDLGLTTITSNISTISPVFPNLLTFATYGPQTFTGDVAGLPNSLINFQMVGPNNSLTGDWSDLPGGLVQFYHTGGDSDISGDLADIPSTLKLFAYDTTDTAALVYSPPHTWANPMQQFRAVSGTAMASADLNNLLVGLASVPSWAVVSGAFVGGKIVMLKGTASGAGLTAITTLTSNGVTVTITP